MKFDFSEWHPLDHPIGSARCRFLYGGWRRHLSLWRIYQAPNPLGALMCRLGRHLPVAGWSSRGKFRSGTGAPDLLMCKRCWLPLDLP